MKETDPNFIGPRTTGNYQTEELCAECMSMFLSTVCILNLREVYRARFCPDCNRIYQEKEAKNQTAGTKTRADRWKELCPAAYLQTDAERLCKEGKLKVTAPAPMGCREFVQAILKRPYSERGLGLTGPVRLGKTRLVFTLLARYYAEGHQVTYTYAPDFSDVYAARMGESATKGNAYLEGLIHADLWFLDDLGKGRLSEAAQRALLRVVEKRTNQLKPIFVTCNNDGETLIARMRYEDTGQESEYARPMVERLREFCDFHQF